MYKCDKCGKIYDWFPGFYSDKKFNAMPDKELRNWTAEHPFAKYNETPNYSYIGSNCIQLRYMEPINDNMSTNNGILSAEVKNGEDGEENNCLLMFCKDCMADLVNNLCIKLEV